MNDGRKGARRMRDIPAEVLEALNRGEVETRSLVEGLAIDTSTLFAAVLRDLDRSAEAESWSERVSRIAAHGVVRRTREMGALLREIPAHEKLAAHPSDTARCWAAYAIAGNPDLGLSQRVALARPFAQDPHSGVREIAWLSVRDAVGADPIQALELLTVWAHEPDPNLRRFASEATRPRGVWCNHIPELKARPEPAAALLDPIRSDPSRYVRDSVGNWLNDASKTRVDWVRAICERWRSLSPTRETDYTIRRGLRTLRKSEHA